MDLTVEVLKSFIFYSIIYLSVSLMGGNYMESAIWALSGTMFAGVITLIINLIKINKENKKIDEIKDIVQNMRIEQITNLNYPVKDHDYNLSLHDKNLDKHMQKVKHLLDIQEKNLSNVYKASEYVNKIRDGFEIKDLKASDFVEFIDYSMSEIQRQKDLIGKINKMLKEYEVKIDSLEKENKNLKSKIKQLTSPDLKKDTKDNNVDDEIEM